jgi:hypothetical protein
MVPDDSDGGGGRDDDVGVGDGECDGGGIRLAVLVTVRVVGGWEVSVRVEVVDIVVCALTTLRLRERFSIHTDRILVGIWC